MYTKQIICLIKDDYMKKYVDRRVKYTKMVLRDALTDLLAHKPISKITVKEICELADINRSTFYSHYEDQFDLLESLKKDLYDNIRMHIINRDFYDENEDLYGLTLNIMKYIKSNKKICYLLFGENGDLIFQKRILNIMKPPFFKGLEEKLGKSKTEYLYAYVISGSIGIIQNWLKNDLKETPEEISALIVDLSSHGLKQY